MVNRAGDVPANEERELVCDVRMGQSQARRAEGGCNYEVVEKGSTILPPLQKPKKVGHPVAVGGHTVAVGEVIKAVDVVRKLSAGPGRVQIGRRRTQNAGSPMSRSEDIRRRSVDMRSVFHTI